jgi:hypothetical protein
VWEEELLGELRSVLDNFVLQPNATDQWVWRHDPGGGYSAHGAYEILTTHDAHDTVAISDLIWHKQVPLKVSVMAWRLLRNRLPTEDNLVRRHIIHPDACLWLWGCRGCASIVYLLSIFCTLVEPHSILGW